MSAPRLQLAVTFLGALGPAFVCVPAYAQTPGDEPKRNPFDRPGFVVNLGEADTANSAAPTASIELRATMVTHGSSLANINGKLLSAGQSFEGFRVLSIQEGRVELSRDGERIVLSVYSQQQGLDENGE